MKGLQAGIPMAVLAAVARAQVTGIGGNHAIDTGNAADFDYNQEHNTGIANGYKDDHSGHWNAKTNVGHFPFSKRDGVTGVAGNGGADIGDAAAVGGSQEHNTGISNHLKDDHSGHFNAKTNVGPKLGFPMRRTARGFPVEGTGIAGNGGVDVGDAAGIGADESVNTAIDNKWKDDHSGHFNYKGDVHPPHCHTCGLKLRDVPVEGTGIGGNGGVDVGNAAGISADEAVNTAVENEGKDDHSGHFNSETNVSPPHPHCHTCGLKARAFPVDGTGVAGNGGADIGDAAAVGGNQAVNTEVVNDFKDDHSGHFNAKGHVYVPPVVPVPVPAPVPHCKKCGLKARSAPVEGTGIAGNGGVDVGDAASADFGQQHNTGVKNGYHDDHSGHFNAETNVHPYPFWKRDGVTGVGGNHAVDVGDAASMNADESANTAIKNHLKDDHSLTDNVKTDVHPVPFIPFAKRGEDMFPEIPQYPAGTGVGGNEATDIGDGTAVGGTEQLNVGVKNKYEDDHSVTGNWETDVKRAFRPTAPQEPEQPQVEVPQMPEPSPAIEHAANTAEAACATETREVIQTVTETVFADPSTPAAPLMAPSSSAVASHSTPVIHHGVMTSSMVIATPSVQMIPISVPSSAVAGSSSAPVSSSAVASSAHVAMGTPASSSAAVPTGVDAMRPNSNEPAGKLFQGSAAHLTPNAGVLTIFCGVMGLLAFVL